MKQFKSIYLFFPVVLALVGCDEILNQLNLDFTTGEQTILFSAGPEEAGAYTFAEVVITSELEKEIEDQGGSIDNIKSAKVNSANISIVSGASNLNAVGGFELWIVTGSFTQYKMAWVDNIADGVTSIDLDVSSDDLKKFLEMDTYLVIVKGILEENVKEEIQLKATLKYDVEVGL